MSKVTHKFSDVNKKEQPKKLNESEHDSLIDTDYGLFVDSQSDSFVAISTTKKSSKPELKERTQPKPKLFIKRSTSCSSLNNSDSLISSSSSEAKKTQRITLIINGPETAKTEIRKKPKSLISDLEYDPSFVQLSKEPLDFEPNKNLNAIKSAPTSPKYKKSLKKRKFKKSSTIKKSSGESNNSNNNPIAGQKTFKTEEIQIEPIPLPNRKTQMKKRSRKQPKPIQQIEFKPDEINTLSTRTLRKLLKTKKIIGKGATSTVYRVINILPIDKKYLSLKILNDDGLKILNSEKTEINLNACQTLLSEYEKLKKLDHPNIIKVYGFYFGDVKNNPAILLEYCIHNLKDAINDNIEDYLLVGFIYEICLAMKYMHKRKMIHHDLKMENILINSENHVKICDFGLSKLMDVETLNSSSRACGTFPLMAPELFSGRYNEKVDVYAFGYVMHFIVTKGTPPSFIVKNNHWKLGIHYDLINKLSLKIIERCISMSPSNRPSFDELLNIIVKNNFMLIDGIKDKIPELKHHLGLN